jgi:hypothetical protein
MRSQGTTGPALRNGNAYTHEIEFLGGKFMTREGTREVTVNMSMRNVARGRVADELNMIKIRVAVRGCGGMESSARRGFGGGKKDSKGKWRSANTKRRQNEDGTKRREATKKKAGKQSTERRIVEAPQRRQPSQRLKRQKTHSPTDEKKTKT